MFALTLSLIVSRQLARFTSPRASPRYLCDFSASALCFPFFSLSGTDLDRLASAPNSLGIISFADHHPVNSVLSYRYKDHSGEGVPVWGTVKNTSCTILVQCKSFRCNIFEPPPKCCKQRTCAISKSFKCNTYKKHRGGGVIVNWKSLEEFLSRSCRRATIGSPGIFLAADQDCGPGHPELLG